MKKLFVSFVIMTAFAFSSAFAQKSHKVDPLDATSFFITIERNGEKTELKSTQFENHDGIAFTNDSDHGKMTMSSRAGNEKINEENFAFTGSLMNDAKGSFKLGQADGTVFTFMTTKFSYIPQFLCTTGAYDITAMPLKGGYVEGTFSANCDAASADGSQLEHYTLSGSFKLLRQ